jgi:hypothetical protein
MATAEDIIFWIVYSLVAGFLVLCFVVAIAVVIYSLIRVYCCTKKPNRVNKATLTRTNQPEPYLGMPLTDSETEIETDTEDRTVVAF